MALDIHNLASCESVKPCCDTLSNTDRSAIDEVSSTTSLSAGREMVGVAFMSAITAIGAGGCCRKEKTCSGQYFDCNDTAPTPSQSNIYKTEYEVPSTDHSTQASAAIERDTESTFAALSGPVAAGASLVIVPWLIMAAISKAGKGGMSERVMESGLMALWGTSFLLLSDDANKWMVPVILTAFVPAVASTLTNHKKKITFLADIAALMYMLATMSGK